MFRAPGGKGLPEAEVGAPRVLAEAGSKRLPDALGVARCQPAGGGGLRRPREGKMSHNGNYRTRKEGPL